MCSISKVTLFDIEGDKPLISKVMNMVVDIEVSSVRYRLYIDRYCNNCMLISYTMLKVFLAFEIEGYVTQYRVRYRIRYSIHPMSFTAERKLPLPRLHHAGAEGSQRHEPWTRAPSFAELCSLIHRDLTRKSPSIAPHPHVDFEQPAPSPAVGS